MIAASPPPRGGRGRRRGPPASPTRCRRSAVSIGRDSSPRQYAPASFISLKAPSRPVDGTCGPRHRSAQPSLRYTRHGVAARDLALASQRLDDLALVGLVGEPLQRLGARQLLADERLVRLPRSRASRPRSAARSAARDRLGELEVVVEAVLDGGPDRVLRARPQVAHGLRHARGRSSAAARGARRRSAGRTGSTVAVGGGTKERSTSSPSKRAAIASAGSTLPTGSPSGRSIVGSVVRAQILGMEPAMISAAPRRRPRATRSEIASRTLSFAARRAGKIAARHRAAPRGPRRRRAGRRDRRAR